MVLVSLDEVQAFLDANIYDYIRCVCPKCDAKKEVKQLDNVHEVWVDVLRLNNDIQNFVTTSDKLNNVIRFDSKSI